MVPRPCDLTKQAQLTFDDAFCTHRTAPYGPSGLGERGWPLDARAVISFPNCLSHMAVQRIFKVK
jgi:hypothetical protein